MFFGFNPQLQFFGYDLAARASGRINFSRVSYLIPAARINDSFDRWYKGRDCGPRSGAENSAKAPRGISEGPVGGETRSVSAVRHKTAKKVSAFWAVGISPWFSIRALMFLATIFALSIFSVSARADTDGDGVPDSCDLDIQNGGASFLADTDADAKCAGKWVISEVDFRSVGNSVMTGGDGQYKHNGYGVSEWYTGNVTDMSYYFYSTNVDTQTNLSDDNDVSGWDLSNVTTMEGMLMSSFRTLDFIAGWDVSNVENMSYMFSEINDPAPDLSAWDVSNVTDFSYMFYDPGSLQACDNIGISAWRLSDSAEDSIDMSYMFASSRCDDLGIGDWDTGRVTNVTSMFSNNLYVAEDLSRWNVVNFSATDETNRVNFANNTSIQRNYPERYPVWGTDGDSIAPTITSLSPLDDAVDIDDKTTLTLTFSEDITTSGSAADKMTITSTTRGAEYIYADSDLIDIVGNAATITLSQPFVYEDDVYIEIDEGFFTDTSTGPHPTWAATEPWPHAGISSTTEWNFVIQPDVDAPEIVSTVPDNGAVDVARDVTLSITFNEDIVLGSGNIYLYGESDAQNPLETYDVTSSSALSLVDRTLTIVLSQDLTYGQEYYLIFESGAVEDIAVPANPFLISDSNTWRFTAVGLSGVSATNSSFVASPVSDLAVGEASTLTVTVRDDANDPVTGVADFIWATTNTATSSISAFTELPDGVYEGQLISTELGIIHVAAAVGGVDLAQTATVIYPEQAEAPTDFLVSQADAALELSWVAPTVTGSSALAGYEVSLDGGLTFFGIGNSSTTYRASGLVNGLSYDVQVRAVNSETAGKATETITITPAAVNAGAGGSYAGACTPVLQSDADVSVSGDAFNGEADGSYDWTGALQFAFNSPVDVLLVPHATSSVANFEDGGSNYQTDGDGWVQSLGVSSITYAMGDQSRSLIGTGADADAANADWGAFESLGVSTLTLTAKDTDALKICRLPSSSSDSDGDALPDSCDIDANGGVSFFAPLDASLECAGKWVISQSDFDAVSGYYGDDSFISNGYGVSQWYTGNITSMFRTFYQSDMNATGNLAVDNDISGWDLSNVTMIKDMFRNASNVPDLLTWDVSGVTDMQGAFYYVNNVPDIRNWDLSSVTTFENMFYYAGGGADGFDRTDLSGWRFSESDSVSITFQGMFAYSTFNQDIGDWNTGRVTNMDSLFLEAAAFYQDLSRWDVADNFDAEPTDFDASSGFVNEHDLHPDWEGDGLDVTDPTLSTVFPADDAIGVDQETQLVLTFSEPVLTTASITETIAITVADGAVHLIYADSDEIDIVDNVVTITPASTFDYSDAVSITIDSGFFTDASSSLNAYAGISDATEWNFDIQVDMDAPQIVSLSPANGAVDIDDSVVLSMTFDEDVQLGSGNIYLFSEHDTLNPVETFDVESSAALNATGNVVTIDPSVIFDYSVDYYVLIDSGAIRDQFSEINTFALTNTDTWRFTSAALPASAIKSQVTITPAGALTPGDTAVLTVTLVDDSDNPISGVVSYISAVKDSHALTIGAFAEQGATGVYTADATSAVVGSFDVYIDAGGTVLSEEVTFIYGEPPSAPSNLNVLQGDGSLSLSWDAPTGDGSSALIGYEYSVDGGITFYGTGSLSTNYTVNHLSNGVTYDVSVRGVNSETTGEGTETIRITPASASAGSGYGGTCTPILAADDNVTLTGTPASVDDAGNYEWTGTLSFAFADPVGVLLAPHASASVSNFEDGGSYYYTDGGDWVQTLGDRSITYAIGYRGRSLIGTQTDSDPANEDWGSFESTAVTELSLTATDTDALRICYLPDSTDSDVDNIPDSCDVDSNGGASFLAPVDSGLKCAGMWVISQSDFDAVTYRGDDTYISNGYGVSDWYTGNVTDMEDAFYNVNFTSKGNLPVDSDISGWDVSNVTTMKEMFYSADEMPADLDLSGWDTSNVTDMYRMFYQYVGQIPKIDTWDVSNVTTFYQMFYYVRDTDAYDNADLTGWRFSESDSVTVNMYGMFSYSSYFNQDIGDWNTGRVSDMQQMFRNATNFNQDLSGWDVPLISSKPSYFDTSSGFANQTDLQPQWGTNGVLVSPTIEELFPLDDATGVDQFTNLIMTFSDDVAVTSAADPKITITPSSGSPVEIDPSSSQLEITDNVAILTLSDPFTYGDQVYVQIDPGFFVNSKDDQLLHAGISSQTDWNFRVQADVDAPLIVSRVPEVDATDVANDIDFVMTFDETVELGAGNINIYSQSDPLTPLETYDVASSGNVSVSDTTLTLTRTASFPYTEELYVLIDSGAIRDQFGNDFAITDPGTWIFTAASLNVSASQSQVQASPDNDLLPGEVSTLTVTLVDDLNAPVDGVVSFISASTSTATSSIGPFSEQGNGVYTADISSSDYGTVVVSVTAGGVLLDQTATIVYPDPPGAPSNLTVTQGDSTLHLSWDASTHAGSSDLVAYQYSYDGGLSFLNISPAVTSYSIPPYLENGTTYDVLLRAVNSEAASDPTETITITPASPNAGGGYAGQCTPILAADAGVTLSGSPDSVDADGYYEWTGTLTFDFAAPVGVLLAPHSSSSVSNFDGDGSAYVTDGDDWIQALGNRSITYAVSDGGRSLVGTEADDDTASADWGSFESTQVSQLTLTAKDTDALRICYLPSAADDDGDNIPDSCDVDDNGGDSFLAPLDSGLECAGMWVISQSDFDSVTGSGSRTFESNSYGVSDWYTANVTDMERAFYYSDFTNRGNLPVDYDISGWGHIQRDDNEGDVSQRCRGSY